MNLSIKKTKIIIFFVLIFFVVLKFFNTPYNLYSILNFSHEKRMVQNYGFLSPLVVVFPRANITWKWGGRNGG